MPKHYVVAECIKAAYQDFTMEPSLLATSDYRTFEVGNTGFLVILPFEGYNGFRVLQDYGRLEWDEALGNFERDFPFYAASFARRVQALLGGASNRL